MHCIDLNTDTLKVLGIISLTTKKLKKEKKFYKICNGYATRFENMKNEKAHTRRKNCCF